MASEIGTGSVPVDQQTSKDFQLETSFVSTTPFPDSTAMHAKETPIHLYGFETTQKVRLQSTARWWS